MLRNAIVLALFTLFPTLDSAWAYQCPSEGEYRTLSANVDDWQLYDSGWEILIQSDIDVQEDCWLAIVGGKIYLPPNCMRNGAYFTASGRLEYDDIMGDMMLYADSISCQ
ncbi:MAG: hypothetical protein A2516_01900 [Alphaproteobacteria bacterium RIFOXYD12_FULL_60_8]|nr:MAG: hypothetical protein A2516_01900 [Alphaproteobacteria bacterium RIFOXYD12_FULL_60_8]